MMKTLKILNLIACGLSVLGGCGSSDTSADRTVDRLVDSIELRANEEGRWTRDFGTVLARGQTLDHAFVFENGTDRPVRLLGAEALTPCCSAVGPIPESVPPGGSAAIPVQLRVGLASGLKDVKFVLQTDDPAHPLRWMALHADLLAEFEMIEDPANKDRLKLGETARNSYRLIRRQDSEAEGGPPSRISIEPASFALIPTDPGESRTDCGILESSNRYAMDLTADSLGLKQVSARFQWPDGREWTHSISWTVEPLLIATPPGLSLTRSAPRKAVQIQSTDRPFRILAIRGEGCHVDLALPSRASSHHILTFEIDPDTEPSGAIGEIVVETDHPDQPRVLLGSFFPSEPDREED